MFNTYLELGFDHILDINGFDHMLFLVALCALYTIKDWKKVLVLVTAFTIGHSVTLALSALDIVTIKAEIIEFLIPLTIFVTAIMQAIKAGGPKGDQKWIYAFTLLFGFIHGMGFSNYFKALLGSSEQILQPLLAFNIGVELGQIIIVLMITSLAYVFIQHLKVEGKSWAIFLSGMAAGVALLLMMETKFW